MQRILDPPVSTLGPDILVTCFDMTDFSLKKGLSAGMLGFVFGLVACDDSSSRRSQRPQSRQPPEERPAEWSGGRLSDASGGTVMIAEFVALNASGVRDGEGRTSDWLEIWNYGEAPVDLTGWSLTDDPKQPAQWQFPEGTLAAGQRGLVWASGRESGEAGLAENGEWHCSFQLSGDGEYLALADAEGRVVHEFQPAYPSQRPDVSYGISPDWLVGEPVAGQVGFLTTPTPAEVNAKRLVGAIGPLTVNLQPGTFPEAVSLAFVGHHSEIEIRYTLDGSSPEGGRGARYDQPLVLDTSRVVRARAFREGYLPSSEFVGTYEIGARPDGTRLALSFLEPADGVAGDESVVALEARDVVDHSEVMRGKLQTAGASYRISFSNRDRSDSALQALVGSIGAVRFDALELHPAPLAGAAAWPISYLREDYLRQLQGIWGTPYLRVIPFRLVVNARDLGHYALVECGDARYGAEYLGGKRGDYDVVTGGAEFLNESTGRPGAVILGGDETAWRRLWGLETGDSLIESGLLDTTSFIDFVLLNQLRRPGEEKQLRSWIALRRRDHSAGFRFLLAPPLERLWREPEAVIDSGAGAILPTLWGRCLESDAFRFRVRDRVHQLLFDSGSRYPERLQPAAILAGHGFDPNPERLAAAAEIRTRLVEWLRAQDLISPLGGVECHPVSGPLARRTAVTLRATEGEIVYTLDGTDPRQSDGTQSALAKIYQEPIRLREPRILSARVRSGNAWGPLTSRAFDLAPGVL